MSPAEAEGLLLRHLPDVGLGPRRHDFHRDWDACLAADPLGHEAVERDHGRRTGQSEPIHPAKHPHKHGSVGKCTGGSDLVGIDIHHPPNERDAAERRKDRATKSSERRARAHEHCIKAARPDTPKHGLGHKEHLSDQAFRDRTFTKTRKRESPDRHAVSFLAPRVADGGILVAAGRCVDNHTPAPAGHLARHVGNLLANGRGVGLEDLTDHENGRAIGTHAEVSHAGCGAWILSPAETRSPRAGFSSVLSRCTGVSAHAGNLRCEGKGSSIPLTIQNRRRVAPPIVRHRVPQWLVVVLAGKRLAKSVRYEIRTNKKGVRAG